MAIRINVTAVRDCPPVEIRAVMSEVIKVACAGPECAPVGDQLDIQEHGGWTWFTTSVWGVSAGDLNRGLCTLARPALQFSTSDGDRWYLTVHGGPKGQVHFLHEFGYHSYVPDPAEDDDRLAQLNHREEPPPVDPRMAFLEEDPSPGPCRPKAPFDLIADSLIEMGANIPDDLRASLSPLPYSAAAKRYREWHAEQVTNALDEAGIAHDPAAVRSVLLWESVTEAEHDGDLGNLPRLLSVLGLGGQWDDWVRQAETPPPPPAEATEQDEEEDETGEDATGQSTVQEDVFEPVLSIVEPLGLTLVAGGPFALPLEDMTQILFFVEALSIHDTADLVLTVTLPPGFDLTWILERTRNWMGSVVLNEDGFRVGLGNHLWFNESDLTDQLGEELAHILFHLPDGSAIDLCFALPNRPAPALTQRYRGQVRAGEWRISETYPPLTREVLADALDLARYAAEEPERHTLRDEAEVKAVVELAKRDPRLWYLSLEQEGQTVWSKSDIICHLPKVIFRHRFAAYWDVAAHDREAAKLYQERLDLQRKMRQAGAEAARRRAAPHDDEVLFRGKLGPYWRSDLARLEGLEQETREKLDAAMNSLGFRHVGDLVAKKQRDVIVRAHASGEGHTYGTLMAKRTMYLGYEFFTRFADGSTLTTTTNGANESRPELKVYTRTHFGLELAALHDKHRWGIDRFHTRKGTRPVPLEPSLIGVARECDRVLARREGILLRIQIIAPPPGEAPAHIREAWVGCVLPLFATTDDPKVGEQGTGVVSGEHTDRPQGFAVRVEDAITALERHNAGAARWWREKTPHLIKPKKLFIYPEDVCKLVEETETPG